MKEYLTVKGQASFEITIKHSRFIANIAHVSGKQQAAEFVSFISKKYSDATHNCYAYIADNEGREQKFADNGEPSGTAGQPILDVLSKNKLFEVCLVVTRYFGGIKLGASGLVGAYSQSAAGAVCNAVIQKMMPTAVLEMCCSYSLSAKTERLILANEGIIKDKKFEQDVTYKAAFPLCKTDAFCIGFSELTSGKGETKYISTEYSPLPK